VLVDGHSMNDQTWGAAPVGTDLPINLDLVERIEIVQGPGSARYGTGAVFAVINIVTKTALALDESVARVSIGSGSERAVGLTTGHAFGSGASITGSGLLTNAKGRDLYYAEFDTPATQNGIARGLDWEHGITAYGTLAWSDLTVHTGYRTRAKGIPTASYGILFGDPRAETVDETFWGDVAVEHDWNGTFTLSGCVYADRVRYRGVYPYDVSPQAYADAGGSSSAGTEVMLRWEPISRVRVTVGTDDKLVTRSAYSQHTPDGTTTSDNAPFHVLSGFAQGEFQLLPSAMLVTGARVDRYSTVGSATTPRVGLILTPYSGTTVKLLYGEAFRAPSAVQALLTAGAYEANPDLRPERIMTTEVDVQQRVSDALLFGVSAYRYVLHDLIDQQATGDATVVRFQNLSYAEATGLEFQVDARPAGPVAAQLSYVLQEATDGLDSTLTNSPHQLANLGITARFADGLRGAVQLRYESGRRTRAAWTSAFVRTDANVGYRPPTRGPLSWLSRSKVSLRVTNLFDVVYATPTGPPNVQDSIAADGRTFALHLEWRF
jgi:iron complex outermembrane receptor protein